MIRELHPLVQAGLVHYEYVTEFPAKDVYVQSYAYNQCMQVIPGSPYVQGAEISPCTHKHSSKATHTSCDKLPDGKRHSVHFVRQGKPLNAVLV